MSLGDYTLDNPIQITSPRSKLAMSWLGIVEQDLRIPDPSEFAEDFPEPHLQNLCVEHYKEKIPKLLNKLKDEWNNIKMGKFEESKSRGLAKSLRADSLNEGNQIILEHEKREMQKLKERQMNELKKMLDAELRASELREAADELVRKRAEQEAEAKR